MASFKMRDLVAECAHIPTPDSLKGVNFSNTNKNRFPNQYWVPIPDDPTNQSSLGMAIQKAIEAAGQQKQDSYFIDIAHLAQNQSMFFSTEVTSKGKTLIQSLQNEILAQGKPVVIRYLEGRPEAVSEDSFCNIKSTQQSGEKVDDNGDRIMGELKKLTTEYANLTLYAGFSSKTTPQNPFGSLPSTVDLASLGIDQMASDLGIDTSSPAYQKWYQEVWDWIKLIADKVFPTSVGWNHAKIFAINGKEFVQGGANFWSGYCKGDTIPVDLATYFQGEAAGSAHKYLDHLWEVLYSQLSTSEQIGIQYKNGNRSSLSSCPKYNFTGAKNYGRVEVLAANTLGMTSIKGGLAVLKDMLYNLVYAFLKGQGLLAPLPSYLKLVDQLIPKLPGQVPGWDYYDIPDKAYYTGRHLRNFAMQNAKSSIQLSQQKLVMDDKKAIDKLDEYLFSKIPGLKWDRKIWPFDSFLALADASRKGLTVEIVCSKESTDTNNYFDSLKVDEFEAMIGYLGGDPSKCSYKRINLNEGRTNINVNHSKLTIIDKSIVNIGSENFYPSYNQEFSIWFDAGSSHEQSGFYVNYWNKLWSSARKA